MKRNLTLLAVTLLFTASALQAQIIADHTVVDLYDDIPQQYIDSVKKMWVSVPGESHSMGYRLGCQLLQSVNSAYMVNVTESGTPEAATDQYLRISKASWGDVDHTMGWRYDYGEEDWYTSTTAIAQTKTFLTYANTGSFRLNAVGFGWCWDQTWTNAPGGTEDPVYHVRWAGSSDGGTDGNKIWGLDAGDSVLTGNRVCMNTYLNATQQYMQYCTDNTYKTKVFFTTGPVDGGGNTGENGYQRSLKNQYIRDYVNASSDRILFDYADILCWNNSGQQQTESWTDGTSTLHTYQYIHDDNMLDTNGTYAEDGDHIGEAGALRLGKAMWWMLARIAGWNGLTIVQESIHKENFSVYPVPFTDRLTIRFAETQQSSSLVEITDMTGKVVYATKAALGESILNIEGLRLTQGVYLLKVQNAEYSEVMRIVAK